MDLGLSPAGSSGMSSTLQQKLLGVSGQLNSNCKWQFFPSQETERAEANVDP